MQGHPVRMGLPRPRIRREVIRQCHTTVSVTFFASPPGGESHGPAIGCVVDGCPSLLPLTKEDIQQDLDRRKPGQSRYTTQRKEPDQVEILSGVFCSS